MTKVLFFGKLSDDLGLRSFQLAPQTDVSITEIVQQLAELNDASWAELLSANNIIAAVDKTIENDRNKRFTSILEIAFFPPVTGG